MPSAIAKLIRNPSKYLPYARRAALQPLCHIFRNSSFFLQGQMDIHPRSRWRSHLRESTGGFLIAGDTTSRSVANLDAYDNTRRDMLALLLRTITVHRVPGAFAEVGVYRGWTARLLHHYAPERMLHLFDTFKGFTARAADAEERATGLKVDSALFSDTSLERVRRYIAPRNENVKFHPGFFPDSLPTELYQERFAFVHLDADLYEPTMSGLEFFAPRMSPRAMIVIHDYNTWPGARKAVDEFFADRAEMPIPMPDKSGSALVVFCTAT